MASPVQRPADAPDSLLFGSRPLAKDLLRLHAALDASELWASLRLLLRDRLKPASSVLEIGHEGDGSRHKIYRHAHPTPPPDWWREHPAGPWLEKNPGAPVCRLSDVISLEELRKTPFYERVMKREGWDRRLSILSWRGAEFQGALHLYNRIGGPDFSARDIRLAERLQPHFHIALSRVLAHEERVVRAEQFAAMLEGVPVGLLILDWEGRPIWQNAEAIHGCAVWNHGERRASALKARRAFRVPAALSEACAGLRRQWEQACLGGALRRRDGGPHRESVRKPAAVSDHALGLHAQVVLREPGNSPLLRPTFQIQLDYRRPRGDRNRPLSPGAVALLSRLTVREREVTMRLREGLHNREIAAELRRSPHTIKSQLEAIYRKLGAKGRTHAAALLNR